MPLLGPHDPLPSQPRRVLVNGTSGSGKTTFSLALSARTGIPHTEIDALYHGPGWVPRPEFVADVDAMAASEAWVTEWQYGLVRARLLERCDLLVWLDTPVPLTMWQVTRRTVVRRVDRQVLWNGNVEGPLHRVLVDRDHILRWAWRTRRKAAARVEEVLATRPDLPVVRLRTRRERTAWLERLSPLRSPRPGGAAGADPTAGHRSPPTPAS